MLTVKLPYFIRPEYLALATVTTACSQCRSLVKTSQLASEDCDSQLAPK